MSAGADALRPGAGTARSWLREELSRSDYHASLTQRFFDWVRSLLTRAQEATAGSGGIGTVAALVLLVLLVVAAALLLARLRGNPAAPSSPGPVFGRTRRTAGEHRELARLALAAGDWDEALVESMRAIAAGLVERGLLGEDAGATAHEVTARAAAAFPGLDARLTAAAAAFDETRYGDQPADESGARELAALEHELRSATAYAGATTGPVAAVPR